MAIPDEEKEGYQKEKQDIEWLVNQSGLSRDFVVWYLHFYHGGSATRFIEEYGPKENAIKLLKDQRKTMGTEFENWQKGRAMVPPTAGERGEAGAQGIAVPSPTMTKLMDVPTADPWVTLVNRLEQRAEAGGGAGAVAGSPGGSVLGSVADVFAPLTPEQLSDLGVGEISEKFGLQRLAIEEPEAFLQAMFDKSGVTPSPPIYGFLRDLMPSIVLLASTKQGQDIIKSPGGAVELNRAINEVISQGYPSAESIMGGLAGLGGLARPFLEGGYEDTRTKFSFVMSTLDKLIGPTMSQPLRTALFTRQRAEIEGDRFLSASARGMYKGDFIDWLRDQGYPIPQLPTYTPTPGAGAEAGAPFVEATQGGVGTTPSGTPAFVVRGGVYKGE